MNEETRKPGGTLREILDRGGLTPTNLGAALGLQADVTSRRVRGVTRWTAREVLEAHQWLKSRGVRHSLIELLRACSE